MLVTFGTSMIKASHPKRKRAFRRSDPACGDHFHLFLNTSALLSRLQAEPALRPQPIYVGSSSLSLSILHLLTLFAVLGPGHIFVSEGIREPSFIYSASGGSSSGASKLVIVCLLCKASIPASFATSPGLGGGCCFLCRGSCPCPPFGELPLVREEYPPALTMVGDLGGAPSSVSSADCTILTPV